MKSVRSQRSVSIKVRRVSKITKVNGQEKHAISQEKEPSDILAQWRASSVDRAAQRKGLQTQGRTRKPPVLMGLYKLKTDDNKSQEDLKSVTSKKSTTLKDLIKPDYTSLTPLKVSAPITPIADKLI